MSENNGYLFEDNSNAGDNQWEDNHIKSNTKVPIKEATVTDESTTTKVTVDNLAATGKLSKKEELDRLIQEADEVAKATESSLVQAVNGEYVTQLQADLIARTMELVESDNTATLADIKVEPVTNQYMELTAERDSYKQKFEELKRFTESLVGDKLPQAVQDNIAQLIATVGNESAVADNKPRVAIPANLDLHEMALAILNGFKPVNTDIFLLGEKSKDIIRVDTFYTGTKKCARMELLTNKSLRDSIQEKIRLISKKIKKIKSDDSKKQLVEVPLDLKEPLLEAIFNLKTQYLQDILDRFYGIVQYPIVDKNGNIVNEYGYNNTTRLFVNCTLPYTYKSSVTIEDVQTALETINKPLKDIPFADDTSLAHSLVLPLTFLCNPMYQGNTPIFLIDSPRNGIGKTLLVQALLTPILGEIPNCPFATPNDEEMQKRITTAVLDADRYFVLDNIPEGIIYDVPSLANAITTGKYKARRLGSNTSVVGDFNAIVIMTGNNPQFTMEIARRCVRIKLADKKRRPEGYAIPDLIEYCQQHREEILNAYLTIIRYAVQEGLMKSMYAGIIMPSFEQWSRIIGGIMQVIGLGKDFLGNFNQLVSDTEIEHLEGAAEFLLFAHKTNLYNYTVKELVPFAERAGIVDTTKSAKGIQTELGVYLNKIKGRRIKVDGEAFNFIKIEKKSSNGHASYTISTEQ
jgi:hypothetical protein